MKKKLIGVAVIAAIAVTVGWNFNQSKNEDDMSYLALANIEALTANGEIIVGIPCAQVCQNCWCIYFDPYEEFPGEPYI